MNVVPVLPKKYAAPERKIIEGDLYISPYGNDSGNGTKDAPFATFERARDHIHGLKNAGALPVNGITVSVSAGEYNTDGIIFEEQDSGTENAPIKYAADVNGEVIINCGFKLDPKDFYPVSGESYGRLCSESRDKVVCVDLKKYGLTIGDYGKMSAIGAASTDGLYDGVEKGAHCELFFNNKRMMIARYPNGNGFLKIAAVRDVGDFNEFPQQNINARWGARNPLGGTLVVDRETNERIKKWKKDGDIWMYGYFYHDWADSSTPVKSFETDLCSVVTSYASKFGFRAGAPYYFYNVFEELDQPGEWYLDRETGILYLYPPSVINEAEIEISISKNPALTIKNCRFMSFEGFTFKCARNSGVIIEGDDIDINCCTVKNIGGDGIKGKGCRIKVTNCEVMYVGGVGIDLTGGYKITLTRGDNLIDNNRVHDYAEICKTCISGIAAYGIGNMISHNEVYNSPTVGIGYVGNDNIVEYNLIHDVVLQSSDAAAIYTGCSWTARGNIIRYNCIYNIGGGEHKPDGIYWDDGLSGQIAYGNILVNIDKYGFLIGGGNENIARHNIIINAGSEPFHYDDRVREGYIKDGWARGLGGSKQTGILWEILHRTPYTNELWSQRYPVLSKFSEDESDPDNPHFPINPAFSVIEENIIVDKKASAGWFADSVYIYSEIKNNEVYTSCDDVGFVDAENGDYRLKEDAPVKKVLSGFPDIPFDKIGRY